MHRKLLALSISFALALVGIQPGVASMISVSMNTDHMSMGHGDTENMSTGYRSMPASSNMEAMDHSCCPDGHEDAPCNSNCDAMSWLACAIHCGMAAPVLATAVEIMFRHPTLGVDRTPTHLSSLVSVGDSPPFHPPKLFIRV